MKKLLLSLALSVITVASAFADDIFIIGSNVNGKSWSLNQSDCKFTKTGDNTYEWTGTVLGTGFKFNNGTWSNDNINYGANGKPCVIGEPYTCTKGGSSQNIALDGVTEIQNPHIVMTWDGANPPTFTILGEGSGEIVWYLAGINGNFVAADDYGAIPLYPVSEDDEDQLESYEFEITVPTGEFKIASTGWGTEYGLYDNPAPITNTNLTATLIEVAGEAGNIPYNLTPGLYTCRFNLDNLFIEFVQVGDVDYSEWWVNIMGPFNNWSTDFGVHPVDGISTTDNLKIGTDGFKVMVNSGGTTDTYYITGDETPIALDTWVQLIVDNVDGSPIMIEGCTGEDVYVVKYDLMASKVYVEIDEENSVGNINTDSNEPAVYYNLQGIRVANPKAGELFIVKQGDSVTKQLIK